MTIYVHESIKKSHVSSTLYFSVGTQENKQSIKIYLLKT